MPATADNWPTYADELTRKASGTLERWLQRYEAKKITRREMFVLTDALWDTISGLAHEDFLRVLEQLHQELRKGEM